jgi:hypothetical protein
VLITFGFFELGIYSNELDIGILKNLGDSGSLASLALVLAIALIFGIHTKIITGLREEYKNEFVPLILLGIALTGLVAFWFAMRVIALYMIENLTQPN